MTRFILIYERPLAERDPVSDTEDKGKPNTRNLSYAKSELPELPVRSLAEIPYRVVTGLLGVSSSAEDVIIL